MFPNTAGVYYDKVCLSLRDYGNMTGGLHYAVDNLGISLIHLTPERPDEIVHRKNRLLPIISRPLL
jgi:hypothetical protein